MKHVSLLISPLFLTSSIIIATSLGSSGASTTNNKQQINFYGTLLTHQGQTDTVNNILIEGKHNDIIMYDAPLKHAKEKMNSTTKQMEIKLDVNPITDFVKSPIDLSKVHEIRVPKPNTLWVYQKEKKYQRLEFILAQVTMKESSTPKEYLMEHRVHITCNSIDNANSQKKEVPLAAVDTLTVEGYSFSLTTDKKINTQSTNQEACPLITKETETKTEVMVK